MLKTQALVREDAPREGSGYGSRAQHRHTARLRRIAGDNLFHKWRWGRVPMAREGGG